MLATEQDAAARDSSTTSDAPPVSDAFAGASSLSRALPVSVVGGSRGLRGEVQACVHRLGAMIAPTRPAIVMVLQDVSTNANPTDALITARSRLPMTPLLFVATRSSEELTIAAFRAGASDYLRWPLSPEELAAAWSRVLPVYSPDLGGPTLLGHSPAITLAREMIRRFAASPCNILITGETGTGKELAAQLLHRLSTRAVAPFVPINCAAIPETLLESELFGFERGAFSGANAMVPGKLTAADGGTVFLDEVGELSLSAQAKLLRAIEQREIQRLGARRPHHVDLRWIAATNRDLKSAVEEGRFRADLYYRLNVGTIALPPVRERREDIGLLASHFLKSFAAQLGRPARLSASAVERLVCHDWPGNVREIRNVVESSLVVLVGSDEITSEDLPPPLRTARPSRASREALERLQLIEALQVTAGNKAEAARRLRWSRMTLYRKLTRYQLM